MIHSSLDQIDGEDYQNAVIKAQENINTVLAQADRTAAATIGQQEVCVEQKICLTNDEE